MQPPKRELQKISDVFTSVKYKDLHKLTQTSLNFAKTQSSPNNSEEFVYRVTKCDPKFPGGTLSLAKHCEAPFHTLLQWEQHTEQKDEDNFLDEILKHVEDGKSFTCLGPPGVGKTHILGTAYEKLQAIGERVACLAPTHCAAQLLPSGHTAH